MIIKNLENQDIKDLHQAFILGFGDYKLPMNLSLERFEGLLKRNSYSGRLSYACFDEDRIAAFIFNGQRDSCIYDSGTAALPSYRKQGLTGSLAGTVIEAMKLNGIKEWRLECLDDNLKALSLYEKTGFKASRSLICWERDSLPQSQCFEQRPIDAQVKTFINENSDYPPSWQNTMQSAISLDLKANVIYEENQIIGLSLEQNHALLQIVVRKDRRRSGLGSLLMANINRVVNTDQRDEALSSFLIKNDFKEFARQKELVLTL